MKNLLVLAAPGAAGVLTHPHVAADVGVAFVSFCLLSSSSYLVNDVRDRVEDAHHPRRRKRPIASGAISVHLALIAAAILAAAGVALAFLVALTLGAIACAYLAVTGLYSLWWRSVPVIDIVAVSACFVLRAMAGGAAAGVPVSRWFTMVACFGALFLVSGKRYAELQGDGLSSAARASLAAYSRDYLRFVMILAASVATGAYCLWAFHGHRSDGITWYEATVAPFVLWLLRYGLLIDRGGGDAPEELVLRDRFLMTTSLAWVAVFACAVYIGT